MNNDQAIFWEEAKKEIKLVLEPSDYEMWVSRVRYNDFDVQNNTFNLSVPSEFIKKSCLEFVGTFRNALSRVLGTNVDVNLEVISEFEENVPVKKDAKRETQDIEISNSKLEKKTSAKTSEHKIYNPNAYTFDSFVVSHSNEYAATTAKLIAENPGTKFNPYFIWGDSGLGKTHLLHAIESYDRQNFPSKKILYLTAEEFLNDFTKSIATYKAVNNFASNKKDNDTMEQFRIKYRQCDVLLIDDIQFLQNKPETQMELFNTFNKLHEDNKQMVFSCDQPIDKVKNMEARLVGRFKSGLTVDLQPPEFELRMAILQNWADEYGVNIDSQACEYIATNVTGNVRALKGMFTNVLSMASIQKVKVVTKDLVADWLKNEIKAQVNTTPISVDKVIMTVAKYFNLKTHELTGVKREKSVAYARHIAMYLSSKLTRLSTTQIGSYFGNKEHATIIHATKKIQERLDNADEKTKSDIEYLIRAIQQ